MDNRESVSEEGGSTKSSFWKTAATVGAVAGAALLAWNMKDLFSPGNDENDEEKMMRCPGRPGEEMRREDFEADPRSYFRELRDDENDENDKEKMMKCPGRPGEKMPRADFEADTQSYFRKQRDDEKAGKAAKKPF